MRLRLLTIFFSFWLIGLLPSAVLAKANLIIILDDLGYRPSDIAAFSLPKEVAFSILPQTPLAAKIAKRADREGRSVMLHMPMQAKSGLKLGPLGLTTDMYKGEITHTVKAALRSVPNAVGLNNHMGSAFTLQEEAMEVLMEEVKRQGLFYIDSRTTVLSKGEAVAKRLGVPNASRHIFLDHELTESFLSKQFERMKHIAKRNGVAVAIGHPHPMTVNFLKKHLLTLEKEEFNLMSLDEYFSYAPKVAKRKEDALQIAELGRVTTHQQSTALEEPKSNVLMNAVESSKISEVALNDE